MIPYKYSAKKKDGSAFMKWFVYEENYERRVSSKAAKVLAAAGILKLHKNQPINELERTRTADLPSKN